MSGRHSPRSALPDLTVLAIPFYFGAMVAEAAVLRRRARRSGPAAGDFERRDSVASLVMGTGSLFVPLVVSRLLQPFTPGRGRWGKAVVATAAGAIAVTTLADAVGRTASSPQSGRSPRDDGVDPIVPEGGDRSDRRAPSLARQIAQVGGVTAVVAGGVAAASTWWSVLTPKNFWRHRLLPERTIGPVTILLAVFGWDFLYYWNHRLSHESRALWATHVVHHSSERYNLSTALRQPVADAVTVSLPYGVLCLFGLSPELVATARGVNLLYQFWIHTETIGRLGPPEAVLNTPSHHRVHHGSNRRYLDRNHGSILIIWDRLFGTFEPEGEPAVYGLTTDIKTFNPARIATHEFRSMLADVAGATSWRDRISYVVRGPGWCPSADGVPDRPTELLPPDPIPEPIPAESLASA